MVAPTSTTAAVIAERATRSGEQLQSNSGTSRIGKQFTNMATARRAESPACSNLPATAKRLVRMTFAANNWGKYLLTKLL